MPNPNIIHHPARIAGRDLSRSQAASMLGISESGVDKLTLASYLPSLAVDHVLALGNIEWAEPCDGLTFAVLRTSPERAAASWDATRAVIGVHANQQLTTFKASNDRWWRADTDRIVGIGFYLVTIATYCIGIMQVSGVRDRERYTTEGGATQHRAWFKAEVAARCLELGPRPNVETFAAASKLPFDPADVCGYRIESSAGGPFAYVPA